MPVRRLKTYSAASGYVYQYYFVGSRALPAHDPDAPATAFVFDVTADRKHTFEITVIVPQTALERWQSIHTRPLDANEQYAAAKLRLFAGFDETDHLITAPRRFMLAPETIDPLLEPLDL